MQVNGLRFFFFTCFMFQSLELLVLLCFISRTCEIAQVVTIAAIGFIIRDNIGNPLLVGAKKSYSLSVPRTEALALWEELSIAFQRGIKKIHIEGDSKLVIDCTRGNTFIPWRLKCVVDTNIN